MELKLATRKLFEGFEIECYEDTSIDNGDFYMTRKQIGEALEYKKDTQLNVIVSRNKEAIKEPTYFSLKQVEGDREVEREMACYRFSQLFQILRFSKQPKANLFMDWATITLQELVMGRAELKFSHAEDKIKYESIIEELKGQLVELKDFAEAYSKVLEAPNTQAMNDIAKVLDCGRNKLFAFLRKKKILMKDNVPYQRFIESKYFKVKEFVLPNDEIKSQTFITGKGLDYIRKQLEKVNYEIG